MTTLNGVDVGELSDRIAQCRVEPERAERKPHLVVEWLGGDRSRVRIANKELEVNGPGQLGPMQLVLAAFASCEIDVIATNATLMGLSIETLTIDVDAHFDVRSYLGLDGPGSGYDQIAYTVRLRAPGATEAQLRRLREAVERASPVGDTLTRNVRVETSVELV